MQFSYLVLCVTFSAIETTASQFTRRTSPILGPTHEAAILAPRSNTTILTLPSQNDTLLSLTSSHNQTLDLKFSRPQCTRWRDTQLNPLSCVHGYESIWNALVQFKDQDMTVGSRGVGIFDLALPTRFLSREFCIPEFLPRRVAV